jgi:bacterioferritin (cytochrome b1)
LPSHPYSTKGEEKYDPPRNSSLINGKEETKRMPLTVDMNPVRYSEDKKIAESKEILRQYPHISNGMKSTIDHIVSSYETRIQSIGTLFDATHQVLQGFHDSLFDTREEREKLNGELRENLAKNKSLRRKDFDNLMEGIILTQNEREKEVRNLLNSYLHGQKEMAQDLRENLEGFRDSIAKGEAQRVKEFQEMIKHILAKQEERKDEVTSRLKEFKKEQKMLASRLKELLTKGRDLRIKDLKAMVKYFRVLSKERLDRQEERKKEVRQLLSERKKVRN